MVDTTNKVAPIVTDNKPKTNNVANNAVANNIQLQAVAKPYLDIKLNPPRDKNSSVLVTSLDKTILYQENIDYYSASDGTSITITKYSAIPVPEIQENEEKPNILIQYTKEGA